MWEYDLFTLFSFLKLHSVKANSSFAHLLLGRPNYESVSFDQLCPNKAETAYFGMAYA